MEFDDARLYVTRYWVNHSTLTSIQPHLALLPSPLTTLLYIYPLTLLLKTQELYHSSLKFQLLDFSISQSSYSNSSIMSQVLATSWILPNPFLEPVNLISWSNQTVVLKVAMSCSGCSGAVKRVLDKLDGVESYDISLEEKKVTVRGNIQPEVVLQTVSKTGKKTCFWEEEAAPAESETKPAEIETKPAEIETMPAEAEAKPAEAEATPVAAP